MRLSLKTSLALGVSAGSAALIVAAGVVAINLNASISSAERRLEVLVSEIRDTADDKLTAALSAVKAQEITMAYIDAEKTTTILQDSAGELTADHLVKRSLNLGDGESLVFAISVASAYESVLHSALLTSVLAILAAILAALVARRVLSRDLESLRLLTDKATRIASGNAEQIGETQGSDEIVEMSKALSKMVSHLRSATTNVQTFLSDASHELRTPLTVIRGYLELLAKPKKLDAEAYDRAVDRASAASLRMQKLVDDLLLLAKLGEIPSVQKTEVVVADIYQSMVADLVAAQPKRKVVVTDRQSKPILASSEMLTVFFSNVFANLVKHTAKNVGVEISVSQSANELVVAIDDAGAGIDGVEDGKSITTFNRFDNDSDRRDLGSGLGFSIMQKVAQLHGGDMTLERSHLGGLRVVARFKAE